ncbi:unnamed protein product [Brachionus calyciflorus]|uniref:RING-type domain-containing protein n=1 Tax=Brachionus calyciflorus TaxID=104777 RepID=A0A813MLQ7_9BILA|nr:unnamed protein product [Brachionus calyciflorus]
MSSVFKDLSKKHACASSTSSMSSALSLNLNTKKMFDINSFLDELKCSICLELFQNPRTLNCQHSFCSKCLEPLAKEKIFACPQCRNTCFYEGLDKIAKNTLLANLVDNLKITKAACPECKELCELIICEHCSQIFCDPCHQKHIGKTLEKLDNRLVTIETLPKVLDTLKINIHKSEQETLLKMTQQMDKIQLQILQLWQSRKFALVDEITQFFKKKSEEIEIADFRLKILAKDIDGMNKQKSQLEQNYQSLSSGSSDSKRITKFFNELSQFEKDLDSLETKFKEAFSKFDINSNELKLHFNEINTTELFKSILDNVKLITSSPKENSLDNNTEDSNRKSLSQEVPVKDYFGKKTHVVLDADSNETIENLKQKVKFLLGVEPRYINFIDKKTNKKLDENLEIEVKDGKVFVKNSEDTNQKDEIELFINYKY